MSKKVKSNEQESKLESSELRSESLDVTRLMGHTRAIKSIQFWIDDYLLKYSISGHFSHGSNDILLSKDDDLSRGTEWASKGYTIAPFLNADQFEQLRDGLIALIQPSLSFSKEADHHRFNLENYHQIITCEPFHSQVMACLRKGFLTHQLGIDVKHLENRVSEICHTRVTSVSPDTGLSGFFIRIVRPNQQEDYNPPHRDVWLDPLRNAINIYLPLGGSNHASSLPLAPGTHHWPESDIERTKGEYLLNGKSFRVPALSGSRRTLQLIRPNPMKNEILVFSPYLIHGGGINLNKNLTRVSLEMRFWRVRD